MSHSSSEVEYLVTGQGIAGTIFSYLLHTQGKSFKVVDKGIRNASTSAAAGIVNPVTGKFFALSWMYKELFPVAVDIYESMLHFLHMEAPVRTTIVRSLKDEYQINEWQYRAGQEKYSEYMTDLPALDCLEGLVRPSAGFGAVKNAMQVPIASIIEKWRVYLLHNDLLIEAQVQMESINKKQGALHWDNLRFDKLVLCEGSGLRTNNSFINSSLQPAKGEALIMHLPGWTAPFLYKDDVFIAPWKEKGLFWIGSTYAWNTLDPSPTQEKRNEILDKFLKFYIGEYEITDHIAGIRPATKDRRPLVGALPGFENCYLFNGLGTKGTSLAPYFAQRLLSFIENGIDLPPEVSPARFMAE